MVGRVWLVNDPELAHRPFETRVLPFGFTNERGTRTSHHLIFVSKHFKGYEIMKGVMASESSSSTQGVPSFRYNPADARFPLLFDLEQGGPLAQ